MRGLTIWRSVFGSLLGEGSDPDGELPRRKLTLGYFREARLHGENACKSRFLAPAATWRITSAH
jgi:hypothetical protein